MCVLKKCAVPYLSAHASRPCRKAARLYDVLPEDPTGGARGRGRPRSGAMESSLRLFGANMHSVFAAVVVIASACTASPVPAFWLPDASTEFLDSDAPAAVRHERIRCLCCA